MRIRLFSISIAGYFLLAHALFAGDLDRRVAVLLFKGNLIETDLAIILSESVRTEISLLQEFDVIDRNNMDLVLKEQQVQLQDCTESECAVRFGEILNVRWIIVGSLSKFGSKYLLMASRVDVQTGQIVNVSQQESVNLEALHDAVPAVARELMGLPQEETARLPVIAQGGSQATTATQLKPELQPVTNHSGAGQTSVPPPIIRGGGEPPTIEWISQPSGTMSLADGRRVTFRFRGNDDRCISEYQYRLDDRPAESTMRGYAELTDIPEGKHTFQVMTGDCDGNWSSPIRFDFTVRNMPPEVVFREPSQGSVVEAKKLAVKLEGSDPDGTVAEYRCAVHDPRNAVKQASPAFEFEVADGPVTIYAQAVDDRGLESSWSELKTTFQYLVVPTTPASQSPRTQNPEPNTQNSSLTPASLDLGNGVTLELVQIPAGSFQMGSPSDEKDHESDEGPVHTVSLDGFWIGKYEVTQAQYQAVMGKNPSLFLKDKVISEGFLGVGKKTVREINPDHPVEQVSWDDAMEFCRKLSQKTGRMVTLPTEAQWEYACRAGSQSSYCFGDSANKLRSYAWHAHNAGGKTHPVGQKKANAWGLYDMHGNVWEWCLDRKGKYPSGSVHNPVGSGSLRVYRGGDCNIFARFCRSAYRIGAPRPLLGFRLAAPL